MNKKIVALIIAIIIVGIIAGVIFSLNNREENQANNNENTLNNTETADELVLINGRNFPNGKPRIRNAKRIRRNST